MQLKSLMSFVILPLALSTPSWAESVNIQQQQDYSYSRSYPDYGIEKPLTAVGSQYHTTGEPTIPEDHTKVLISAPPKQYEDPQDSVAIQKLNDEIVELKKEIARIDPTDVTITATMEEDNATNDRNAGNR